MEKFDKKENLLRVNQEEMEDIGIVTHYKGKPFTGIAFEINENGNLIETEMLEGLRHGKATAYFDDYYHVNYYENDLKIGHDIHTYDEITNEEFPNEKYELDLVLEKIQKKIKNEQIWDDVTVSQGGFRENSESYYHTLAGEMVQSLKRQNKLSENAYIQAEKEFNKDND